jgi:hypothetical protein
MLSMLRISAKKVMQGMPSVRGGFCTFSVIFDICFVILDLLSTLARASTQHRIRSKRVVVFLTRIHYLGESEGGLLRIVNFLFFSLLFLARLPNVLDTPHSLVSHYMCAVMIYLKK